MLCVCAPCAGAGGGHSGSDFQTFRFRSAEEVFSDVFGEDEDLFSEFFDQHREGDSDSETQRGAESPAARGHTEVTKTRTITRTSTVDGQQRSVSRTRSVTNTEGVTFTKRAGERMTTDGR